MPVALSLLLLSVSGRRARALHLAHLLEQPPVPAEDLPGLAMAQTHRSRTVATGAPAVQINTGKGCHLDAHMVAQAMIMVGKRIKPLMEDIS